MYNGNKILSIIPARGGSKGIKDKNIIDLCGKPLVVYTVEAAKSSRFIDDVIISTDSQKIAEIASMYGAEVPFMRPPELAADLVEKGVYLAGGGALIQNLDKLLSKEINMPVIIAESPLDCVVNGTGKTLEELEKLKNVLINSRKRH